MRMRRNGRNIREFFFFPSFFFESDDLVEGGMETIVCSHGNHS